MQLRLEGVLGEQAKRAETASAEMQAERTERAALADRLSMVVRDRDALRHDVEAVRSELSGHAARHDASLQVPYWPAFSTK